MSTGPFPELASESVTIAWAEKDPTKVLGRRRNRWCLFIARGGGRRRRCRPWKNDGAWGKRKGLSSPPKSIPLRGRFAVCASVERSRW